MQRQLGRAHEKILAADQTYIEGTHWVSESSPQVGLVDFGQCKALIFPSVK